MSLKYDEEAMVERLRGLPPVQRTLYALLCVSRILPAYRRYQEKTGHGDADAVEAVAERLWEAVEGGSVERLDLEAGLSLVSSLMPSEDDWDDETQPYAEDALAALAYAIRAQLTEDPQEAAWAGRRCYEAAEYLASSLDTVDSTKRRSPAVADLLPIVKAELEQQNRDLENVITLAGTDDVHRKAGVGQLRKALKPSF